jgi:hypothetical protein
MDTYAPPSTAPVAQADPTAGRVARWLPLAGAAYAVLTIAGDLVVGDFPDENTPLSKLTSYYAAHHAQVDRGGRLMEISALFIALFGVALAVRVWHSHQVAAAVLVVGAATTCLGAAYEGATFQFLGEHGSSSQMSPQALQAWHMSAASFGTDVPILLLVLGMVLAGRALPAWLVWSAVVLAVAQFTPVGFLAGMVMLLWFVAAGVTLATRPVRRPLAPAPR